MAIRLAEEDLKEQIFRCMRESGAICFDRVTDISGNVNIRAHVRVVKPREVILK